MHGRAVDAQAGQVGPAGHHGETGRGAEQEGAHLGGREGAVQEDGEPQPRGQRPPQRTALREPGRHRGGAERDQEGLQDDGRGDGTLAGPAAQVRVELAVGEVVGVRVQPVGGEGGLADAGESADHQELRSVRGPLGTQGVQRPAVVLPPGEPRCHRGELTRDGEAGRGRRGGRVEVEAAVDVAGLHGGSVEHGVPADDIGRRGMVGVNRRGTRVNRLGTRADRLGTGVNRRGAGVVVQPGGEGVPRRRVPRRHRRERTGQPAPGIRPVRSRSAGPRGPEPGHRRLRAARRVHHAGEFAPRRGLRPGTARGHRRQQGLGSAGPVRCAEGESTHVRGPFPSPGVTSATGRRSPSSVRM